MRTATRLGLLAVLAVALGAPPAHAQFGRAIGDQFVFFSDSSNFRIPLGDVPGQIYFNTVEDPEGRFGSVAAYSFFNDSRTLGFRFSGGREGISMLGNVVEGDTLYFKFRATPEHADVDDENNFTLRFEDRFGSLGSVASGNNVAFRADWPFPDSLLDGTWHDLAIPLPPATYAALQEVKDSADPDPFRANWVYSGSTGDSEGAIGTDGLGPNTAERPEFWREFEWAYVQHVGTYWPVDPSGDKSATVYFDDVYIGDGPIDLSAVQAAPDAYDGTINAIAEDNGLIVNLEPTVEDAAYGAYFSGSAITGRPATAADSMMIAKAPLVEPLLTPPFAPNDLEALAVRYAPLQPHPNVGPKTVGVYYAISGYNMYGVESDELVTGGPVMVDRALRPWVFEVAADSADAIIDDLSNGVVDPTPLNPTARRPFTLGVGEGDAFNFGDPYVDGDADAEVWVAFADDSEDAENTLFIVYAEVEDDLLIAGQDEDQDGRADGSAPEKYDSIYLRFGGYEVEDGVVTGGNAPGQGSPERPDYGLYFQLLRDNPANTDERMITGIDARAGDNLLGDIVLPAVERTATGYRFMAVFGANEIDGEGQDLFAQPDEDEIHLHPFSLNLQDQDFGNVFSTSNRTRFYDTARGDNEGYGPLFATPLQWPAAAFVGLNVMAVDAEDGPDVAFGLGQSYPNPVRGATATVEFELGEPGDVSLRVFNVLGQEVVTVLDGEGLPAGPQSVAVPTAGLAAGVYFYRLTVGTESATRRMLVVR